jgi:hypothetical protein
MGIRIIWPTLDHFRKIVAISGCTDHKFVLQELLSYTRKEKKMFHCTFLDVADAFGSASR